MAAVSADLPVAAVSADLPVVVVSADLPVVVVSADLPVVVVSADLPVAAVSADLPVVADLVALPVAADLAALPVAAVSADLPVVAHLVAEDLVLKAHLKVVASVLHRADSARAIWVHQVLVLQEPVLKAKIKLIRQEHVLAVLSMMERLSHKFNQPKTSAPSRSNLQLKNNLPKVQKNDQSKLDKHSYNRSSRLLFDWVYLRTPCRTRMLAMSFEQKCKNAKLHRLCETTNKLRVSTTYIRHKKRGALAVQSLPSKLATSDTMATVLVVSAAYHQGC